MAQPLKWVGRGPPPLHGPLLVGGNVLGQLVPRWARQSVAPLIPAPPPQLPSSGAPPSAPLASWSIPSLQNPPQRPPGSSEFPLWVGEAALRPPAYNLHSPPVWLPGRATLGSSLRHPFPAEPGASLGSRRNRLQNAGARPRCLRAPLVARPMPAAQNPACLAL